MTKGKVIELPRPIRSLYSVISKRFGHWIKYPILPWELSHFSIDKNKLLQLECIPNNLEGIAKSDYMTRIKKKGSLTSGFILRNKN